MPKIREGFLSFPTAWLRGLQVGRKTSPDGKGDKNPPRNETPAAWRRLTCTAGGTPGADSQGPGARRLNALQENGTNRSFIVREHPKTGLGRIVRLKNPRRELGEHPAGPQALSTRGCANQKPQELFSSSFFFFLELFSSFSSREAPTRTGRSQFLQETGPIPHIPSPKTPKHQILLTGDRSGLQSPHPALSVLLPLVDVLQNTDGKPVVIILDTTRCCLPGAETTQITAFWVLELFGGR